MKLEKGDIVEIIEKDGYEDLTFELGTKWIVKSDHPNNLLIEVEDSRHRKGVGYVYASKVKQVNLPKQNYNFKVGQIYKVIAQGSESPFSYDKFYAVKPEIDYIGNHILSDDGLRYEASDFGNSDYNTSNTYLELVADVKESTSETKLNVKEPTIEVQFLLDYIEKETLNYREIIAFLKGYMKGERFKND